MRQFDAAKIREFREARGWSQDALAARMSAQGTRVYVQQISMWETGKTTLTMTSLARVCKALSKNPDNFFSEKESLS